MGEPSITSQLSEAKDVQPAPDALVATRVKEAYGRLPITFEENAGQHDEQVKYSARGSGFQLFLTSDEAVLALSKPSTQEDRREDHLRVTQKAPEHIRANGSGAVLRLKLVGANGRARVQGEDELAAKSNYFTGAQPENWQTGVAMFEKVRYREVYPGIDMVYYGNQRQLEYDFVLAPHADPARIKFKFSGAQDLHLDAEGHLLLQTKGGYVRQEKPFIYQLVDGERQQIAGRYAIEESGEIGFKVDEYDRSQPLVIDPVLGYSTYLGGASTDQSLGIALDGQGNAYITGFTSSSGFPTARALQATRGDNFSTDAFVLKLNARGSALVYSTYLGGDGEDSGNSIAVDAAGNAYITGVTDSKNFPSTSGALQESNAGDYDAFVTKLNAAGDTLVYSSHLGGKNFDQGYGIAIDASGNAYVTGEANSNTFVGGVSMPKQGHPVYKSGDAGLTWSAQRSGLLDPYVTELTIDPTNSGILYAASNSGVYKTYDGGAFWSLTGQGSSAIPYSVNSVVVDPSTPTTIYAGSSGGIYKSTNGGDHWADSSNGLQNAAGFILCMALDPNNPSTLYAGTGDGVYKSVNGGALWVRASQGFPQNVPIIDDIIFDPTDSKILYAASPAGIYKSVDGATNWTALNNGLRTTSGVMPSRFYSLAINPASPATLYAGSSVGIFRSTDGGLNWLPSNNGLSVQPNSSVNVPQITDIVINPAATSILYASSSQGGVFKSTDGGVNWTVSSNGLANLVVTSLVIDHTATANVYAGTYSYSDAFVVKINATGASLGYQRYLGGNENDDGRSIAVDASGNAYLTGETRSLNFQTLNPLQATGGGIVSDAFVAKLDANGSTVYATYLGGNGNDVGRGIAVGADGNAYVTGSTASTNFPMAGARQTSKAAGAEIFVSRFSVAGSSLDYSIYHGGGSNDQGYAIALDGAGNAYVTGATASSNFPLTNGVQATHGGSNDVFVLKLGPTSEVLYSTYLGGSSADQGFGIAADSSGTAFITGTTSSFNFPTQAPLKASAAGDDDAFIAKITTSADLSVTMTDAPDPVMAGENLTYTIRVANVGEMTATGVRLTDTLPAGSVLVSAHASTGTCSGTDSVNCALGTFTGGASATVTIVIKTPTVRTITNTASVIADEPEVRTNNNAVSESTQVNFADLKITKTLVHDLVRAGGNLVYFVKVTNLGGATTGAVTLTDNLPAGLTFAACSSTGRFVCGGTGNNRTATLPSLAVGESERIILTASVDASVANGTLISNTASVSSNLPDPRADNNESTVAATVTDMPIPSRSNGKIAYATSAVRGIRVINADGTGKTTYGGDNFGITGHPSWSPDGSKLAFWVSDSSQVKVHVLNSDGLGRKIIDVPVFRETSITWSPHGTHLAFIGINSSVYLAQADGTEVTKLINNLPLIRKLGWSPDGQKFAFERDGTIYLMNIDGSNVSRLTGGPNSYSYQPRWSPDGSKLLFLRYSKAYTINADGTEERLLFDHQISEASWSPDGTKLVFVLPQDRLIQQRIATINLDGTDQREVAYESFGSFTNYVSEPDWQPLSASPRPTPKPTYSISGHVSRPPFSFDSMQVALSGTVDAIASIESNGNYSFTGLPAGGDYTVTPVNPYLNFDPVKRTFNNLSGNQTSVNFAHTGSRNYSISGRVTDANGAPLGDIEVTLDSHSSHQKSVRTGPDGTYAFQHLGYGQIHTVFMPLSSRMQYDFVPEIKTFTLTQSEIVNFVGASKNSFRFSINSYSIGEGDGHATVVVTRAGSPAAPASVTVQTYDDPAAVPCDPTLKRPDGTAYPQGTAYARCDYATTVETLQFAPSEMQKTVNIPIIDDVHVEGTETLLARLNNAVGATLAPLSEVNVVIHDNDTGTAENPTRSTGFFVRQHYLDFLSREPEPGEPWSGVLNRCANPFNLDAQSPSAGCDRLIVSQSFFGSPEFRLKGFFVFNFYRVAFDRRPEYAEIIPDMSALSGRTAAEVYARRAALPVTFTGRAEFKARYDALTDTAYVNTLLDRYGLQQLTTPDPQQPEANLKVALTRAELVNRLGAAAGSAQALTRAQVLRAVVESDEVGAAEYKGAFVAMQYYGYLRRTPEESGYQAWLRVINEDPNNIRIMVNGFMNSTEYRLRFGQP